MHDECKDYGYRLVLRSMFISRRYISINGINTGDNDVAYMISVLYSKQLLCRDISYGTLKHFLNVHFKCALIELFI